LYKGNLASNVTEKKEDDDNDSDNDLGMESINAGTTDGMALNRPLSLIEYLVSN